MYIQNNSDNTISSIVHPVLPNHCLLILYHGPLWYLFHMYISSWKTQPQITIFTTHSLTLWFYSCRPGDFLKLFAITSIIPEFAIYSSLELYLFTISINTFLSIMRMHIACFVFVSFKVSSTIVTNSNEKYNEGVEINFIELNWKYTLHVMQSTTFSSLSFLIFW